VTAREREARRLRLFLARLQRDQGTATAVHARLRVAVERVRSTGDDPVAVAAVALYLQNLYTALEALLLRIAADLDGSVPAGDEWHRELLGQMTLEISGVRPLLLDSRLHADLDLMRRFRHVVRHAYAADYDWREMQPVLDAAERSMQALPDAVAQLVNTILTVIDECERGP
jgi:hypothetical protein